jgi:hypothetical protein
MSKLKSLGKHIVDDDELGDQVLQRAKEKESKRQTRRRQSIGSHFSNILLTTMSLATKCKSERKSLGKSLEELLPMPNLLHSSPGSDSKRERESREIVSWANVSMY